MKRNTKIALVAGAGLTILAGIGTSLLVSYA